MMLTPTRKNAPTAALEIIHDLIPLKTTNAPAKGLSLDTETIIENIEDRNYWIVIKKGQNKTNTFAN